MTTALDVIRDSLEMLGVDAPGEEISGADSARALTVFTDMIDSWSNESLACFAWLTQSFPLVSGQSIYTVGPGGDINGTRPIRISDAAGGAYLLDQNQNRYMMNVVDQLTFNVATTSAVNSNIPDTLFYDAQFPLGNVNIWPIPNDTSYTCYFLSYLQLIDPSDLVSVVAMPPGYTLAFKTNLAIALKPYFSTAVLDPIVLARAAESKRLIKVSNIRTQQVVFEA